MRKNPAVLPEGRAPYRDGRFWARCGVPAKAVLPDRTMLKYALPALLLAASGAAFAVPGGPIDVLAPAAYACEMPGDATNAAGYRVDDENFAIANSTSYFTPEGRGTYLLTGDLLVLTSGPKKGNRYRRASDNLLRKLDAQGKDTALRCVRKVLNNTSTPACDGADGEKLASCKRKGPVRL